MWFISLFRSVYILKDRREVISSACLEQAPLVCVVYNSLKGVNII